MGRKSVHLKLGTGQRDLEEEKSEVKGSPLTLSLREVTFGPPVGVCGSRGFPWPVHVFFHAW